MDGKQILERLKVECVPPIVPLAQHDPAAALGRVSAMQRAWLEVGRESAEQAMGLWRQAFEQGLAAWTWRELDAVPL